MIRRILEYLDNKKELKEMQKEYSQMKEVLTFNFEKQDEMVEISNKLVNDILLAIEGNEYNNMFDTKIKLRKIKELINDFGTQINSFIE